MFLGRKKDSGSWRAQGGGAELRGHPRMPIRALVAVRAFQRRETNCKLVDLSLGGLALNIPYSLEVGAVVSLTLGPPSVPKAPPEPAFIDARVCRVVPSQKEAGMFQTGVRFENMSDEAQTIVRLWFEFFGEPAEKRAGRK